MLTGSAESTTVGNFAIQLTSMDEDYGEDVGVSASAVAKWASVLAAQPIEVEK